MQKASTAWDQRCYRWATQLILSREIPPPFHEQPISCVVGGHTRKIVPESCCSILSFAHLAFYDELHHLVAAESADTSSRKTLNYNVMRTKQTVEQGWANDGPGGPHLAHLPF